MKTSKQELLDSLSDILPYGMYPPPSVVDDMPQFISEYLSCKMMAMIEKYPHREKQIRDAYGFIQFDLTHENNWAE